ncbi:putative Mg2+ transporter-C (MgtC) family protein [Herbinix hemicellulosilytica]|uniref:Putative membrane protein n=1 Tax=Herbinix hemicellulosilytica TaxID=1564487 RepID=A0A0H5SXX9_HERHM|nr:MgtC/SapB family protein [Herbinix hemicellulosilytica]RBP59835.1 putative Mg2+ transporter-C (MgtC) family protein [Herbinix hemicellulosilytica]CRZ35223.1 putative membrane protein [Herbinix hemicellulosilytica]
MKIFGVDLYTINDVTIILRLVLAVLLGGIIGFERGRSGRPAGLRTHILVCLGSALAIMTNQYIYENYGVSDPARIAAQVVSGIGFLGAGTILVTGRHQVKGLTTAAGLWATACMGLAVGIGFYKAAIVTCILISFATVILHRFDNFMLYKSKIMDIYMEFSATTSFSSILEALKKMNISIEAVELVKPTYNTNTTVAAIMTIKLKQKKMKMDVLSNVCAIEGVEFAEEI